MMRQIILSVLLIISFACTLSAQTWREPERPDFTTFFDLQVGITGAEMGLSYQRTELLAIGIFAEAMHSEALHSIESGYLTGFKFKFYRDTSPNRLFIGPVTGAHGFGGQISPFAGLTLGFDHYTGFITEERMSRFRFGVELKAGLDVRGDGFVGISVGFGFGWNNKHVRMPKKNDIPLTTQNSTP